MGITQVVDLRAEAPDDDPAWPIGVTVQHLHLVDHAAPSPEDLAAAVSAVQEAWHRGETVFTHCHAGIERSATVVCAVLIADGWTLDEAYRTVREKRPVIAPTRGQLDALTTFARDVAARRSAGSASS